MEHIKTVKSTLSQTLSIEKLSYGGYAVITSSGNGFSRKDFATLEEAERFARKRAGIMK